MFFKVIISHSTLVSYQKNGHQDLLIDCVSNLLFIMRKPFITYCANNLSSKSCVCFRISHRNSLYSIQSSLETTSRSVLKKPTAFMRICRMSTRSRQRWPMWVFCNAFFATRSWMNLLAACQNLFGASSKCSELWERCHFSVSGWLQYVVVERDEVSLFHGRDWTCVENRSHDSSGAR